MSVKRMYSVIFWLLVLMAFLLVFLLKGCNPDASKEENKNVPRETDTSYVNRLETPQVKVRERYDRVIIEVKPDTLLRKEVQKKNIILSVRQTEKRRFLRKPEYVVSIQSINPQGVKTDSVRTFSAPQQILVTADGLQVQPMKEKGKAIRWVFIGLTFIAGVAAGLAAN